MFKAESRSIKLHHPLVSSSFSTLAPQSRRHQAAFVHCLFKHRHQDSPPTTPSTKHIYQREAKEHSGMNANINRLILRNFPCCIFFAAKQVCWIWPFYQSLVMQSLSKFHSQFFIFIFHCCIILWNVRYDIWTYKRSILAFLSQGNSFGIRKSSSCKQWMIHH